MINNSSSLVIECVPIETAYPEIVDYVIVRLLFGFLYSIIWLLCIVGNTTILYVAMNKKVSFTVRTIFITSLAGSDLIIGIMSLPITAVSAFTRVWPFAEVLCWSVGFFQASSIFISSFTLTAIAVDRYHLILNPASNYITYERARVIVVFIWFIGYCFASPLVIFVNLEEEDNFCGMFCAEKWPSTLSRRFYGLNVLLLQVGLPVLISSFCYASISRRLARQISFRKHSTILPEAERRLINRRRRTNLMMSLMVVFFVLAWLPLNVINLLRDFELVNFEEFFNFVFVLCHLTSMTSLVWNPIIYSFFNRPFRTAFKTWLIPLTMWYRKSFRLSQK